MAIGTTASASSTPGDSKPDSSTGEEPGQDSYAMMIAALGKEKFNNQLDLMRFKTWMVDQGLVESTGYVQSFDDTASRHTTLYWGPGLPPAGDPFREKIEAEAKARDITMSIEAVPYTQQDINRASITLMESKDTGFPVYYVDGPTPDSPTLTVVGKIGALDPKELSNRLQAMVDIDLPVVVNEGEPLIPFATRGNDTAPFNAGGMMYGGSSGGAGPDCSSGFAVMLGSQSYTSTARHCTASVYKAWDNHNTSYGSRVATDSQAGGILLSQTGFYWMFDGAWNDSTGYKKTVKGLWDVNLGHQMCDSGAATGVHCQLTATNMSVWWNDGFGSIQTIRIGTTTAAAVAGGQGDSGGPIFIPSGDGEVHAIGILQAAGAAQFTCGTSRSRFGSALCSKSILFTSERVFVQNLHGTLRVG